MARLFLLAFDKAGPITLVKRLRNEGHKVALAEPRYPDFWNLLKQQLQPPEVFLFDASMLLGQALEAVRHVRGMAAHARTPFIAYNVKPENADRVRAVVPAATLVADDDVAAPLAAVRPAQPKT